MRVYVRARARLHVSRFRLLILSPFTLICPRGAEPCTHAPNIGIAVSPRDVDDLIHGCSGLRSSHCGTRRPRVKPWRIINSCTVASLTLLNTSVSPQGRRILASQPGSGPPGPRRSWAIFPCSEAQRAQRAQRAQHKNHAARRHLCRILPFPPARIAEHCLQIQPVWCGPGLFCFRLGGSLGTCTMSSSAIRVISKSASLSMPFRYCLHVGID